MRIEKYKGGRHWGLWDAEGTLVAVVVYKKGACEIMRRLLEQRAAQATEKGARK